LGWLFRLSLRLVLLLRLGLFGITALALVAAITPVPIVTIAVVVVPVTMASTVALALFPVLLLFHFVLHLFFSLRAGTIEVLGTLPSGLSVRKHILDEKLDTVADAVLRWHVFCVHQQSETIEDFVEVGLLIFFFRLLDIVVEDWTDLFHKSDGTLNNQIVHVIIEVTEAEQRLENIEERLLWQKFATVKLADELIVTEQLRLEDDCLLELISVDITLLLGHLGLVDDLTQDLRVFFLRLLIEELLKRRFAVIE
jgi:hypothetical protein